MPDNWVLATRKPSAITTAATMRVEDLTTVPRNLFQYDSWQDEAWAMWRALGEANQAIGWISQSLSRVRLNAAELVPGGDEPEILVTGAAADLMRAFCGGPAGQSMFMEAWGVYGGVPGEAWMVVEREDESVPLELASWRLMPTTAVRNSRGPVEVRVAENLWRPVVEGFAAKIFKEDPQFPWKAWSPMQAALPIMRRIDLIDRRIVALMVSRLAMNGLLLIPQEGKWTIPKRFKDAANPFMEMMLESAAQNIKTPGAASAAIPILISYAAEYIEKWRLLTWPDVLPAELLTEREQEIRRLATTANVPMGVITGEDSNHWCTTPDTQIMTRSGWRSYDQIVPGDQVLTLNHETGLSEWQPLLAVNTWQVEDEEMVRIEGRRHSSITTAAHRWPILVGKAGRSRTDPYKREWITSKELQTQAELDGPDKQRQDYLVLGAACVDLPQEAKYSDALVEVVAWYYTEGTKGIRPGRNTPKVIIAQSHRVNPEKCARIERSLTALFGPRSERLSRGGRFATPESVERNAKARQLKTQGLSIDEIAGILQVSDVQVRNYLKREPRLRDNVPRWVSQKGTKSHPDMTTFRLNSAAAEIVVEHAPACVVSLDFINNLTFSQLKLFIDVSVQADGHYAGGTTPMLSQKDPAMCDAFELAGILVGLSPNRRPQEGIGLSASGPILHTQEVVTLAAGWGAQTFAPRGRSFTTERYTGTIWCPTTPNGTWLARHNGKTFFTGNSEWLKEESAVKRYISPPVEILADGVTKGYLHPLLKQMGEPLVGPNGGKIVVWYDVSELVTPPDKSQHVKDAYDRLEANGAALRRELGLDEADRPEGDELSDQILKKLATLPATATQALQELTGVVLQAPASGTPPILGPDGGGAGLPADAEQSGAQLRTAPRTQPDTARREQIATAGVRVGAPSPRPRVYNGVR